MPEPINYASNSKKNREPDVPSITDVPAEPQVEKVIQGTAVTKKPSLGRRLRESMAGDDAQTVGQYLMFNVIVPALKSTVTDVVSQGIERMLYGDTGRASRGSGRTQHIDYNSRSTRVGRPDPRERETLSRETRGYEDLAFETRADAELVLDGMIEQLREYGSISVARLYDLAGVTAMGSFQDNKWGWLDLRGVSTRGTPRNGYILNLPRPVALD
jgi:hypothetical protein